MILHIAEGVRYLGGSHWGPTKRFQLCQTLRASPAELGGLLFLLRCLATEIHLVQEGLKTGVLLNESELKAVSYVL